MEAEGYFSASTFKTATLVLSTDSKLMSDTDTDTDSSDQKTELFQSLEWAQFEPLVAPLLARQTIAVDEYALPHVLCSKCTETRTLLQELNLSELQPGSKREIAHHASGVLLESSARAGCHLCSLLWDSLADLNRLDGLSPNYGFRRLKIGREGTQITLTIKKEVKPQHSDIEESIDPPKAHLEVYARLLWRREHCFFGKPLKLVSLTGTKNQDFAEHQTALSSKYTASSASFLLASRWIEECLRKHSACSKSRIPAARLPTRLIDVGPTDGSQDPRLYITSNHAPAVPYLTLSHCWGGAEIFKLTLDTYSILKSGVSTQCLPRTFQDAIIITRRLGYRFLWIDSLCILQDSKEDWEHEAATMGEVYGNSTCTIAALGAANSYDGCFARRDPLRYRPCRLFGTDDSGIYAFPSSGLDVSHKSFNFAPLNKRGWAFQERLLSPRTLNYGATLTWECQEHLASEPEPQGHSIYGISAKRCFHQLLSPMNSSQSVGSSRFFACWAWIVQEYSRAELTFDRDRYFALSGVTSAIETSTGLRYFSGLRTNFERQGLLWTVVPSKDIDRGKIRRPTGHKAPSWSWTSVLDPSSYPSLVIKMEADNPLYQWLVEIVETSPTPASSISESSIIIHGEYITISAHLKEVVIRPFGTDGSRIDNVEGKRNESPNSDYKYELLSLDTQEYRNGPAVLLPMLIRQKNRSTKYNCIHGLLLLPTKLNPHEYKRIGYFVLMDVPNLASYQNQDRVTITLI